MMTTIDREHRSRQCKSGGHDQCAGYYGMDGSSWGYDTLLCHCDCPGHPLAAAGVAEVETHNLAEVTP